MSKRVEYSLVLCSLLSLVLSCQPRTSGSAGVEAAESQVRSAARKNSVEKGQDPDAAGGEQQMVLYSGEGFRLTLPSGVRVEKEEPAGDFILYSFINEGKFLLRAYVGNQPTFLFEDRAIGPEGIARLNGLPCKRAQAKKEDGTLRTEVLVRFPRDRGWPMYIHFWYFNLESESQAKAEAIIASLMPQAQGAQLSSFPDTRGPDFPPPRQSTEEVIAEIERQVTELKQQPGTAEEVKKLEADLEMWRSIQRSEQEERRMSPEEREKQARERERLSEEADDAIIASMEQDLEEMKKQQGMTKEVKEFEAYLAKMKEDLRLSREKKREGSEGKRGEEEE